MLEFTLSAGLLFLLLFGMMDLGLALNAKLVVATAAREGARRAAIEGGETPAVLERIAAQLALGRIDEERAEVQVSPHTASFGNGISVIVEVPYRFISPAIQSLAPNGVTLRSEAITRSERVR